MSKVTAQQRVPIEELARGLRALPAPAFDETDKVRQVLAELRLAASNAVELTAENPCAVRFIATLRGPEGPLFHGGADRCGFFRNL